MSAFNTILPGNWTNPATWSFGTTSATQPTDGGFESPAISDNSFDAYPASGEAWTLSGSAWTIRPPSAFGAPAASEGSQVIALRSTASLSQSFTWPAATFRISARVANRSGSTNAVLVKIDGTTVGTFTPASTSFATFVTPDILVSAGSHSLALVGTGGTGDEDCFIDAVVVLDPATAIPGNGDTVTLNHAVTLDANATVGTSPSDETTMAVSAAAGVVLTLDAGVTLRLRGNAEFNGDAGGLTMGAGSSLIFDPTLAGTPATEYQLILGTGFLAVAALNLNGSSGSRVTITSEAAGGAGQISGSFTLDGDYVDFERVGVVCGLPVTLAHFTFDGCSMVDVFVDSVTDGSFSNTLEATYCCKLRAVDDAAAKTVARLVFDESKPPALGGNKITYEHCVFPSAFDYATGVFSLSAWEVMTGCFVRVLTNDSLVVGGPIVDTYALSDQTAGNPHILGAIDVDGIVFDYPHPFVTDAGDCLLKSNVSGTLTIQRCLVLPSYSDGIVTGYLATLGGAGDVRLLHNTIVGIGAKAAFQRDYSPTGTIFTQVKSNLLVAPTGTGDERAAAVFDLSPTSTPDDVTTGSGCTHNGFYNPISYTDASNGGAIYAGYKAQFPTSGTPGTSDVIADPGFLDTTRSLATWAVHKAVAVSGDTLRDKLDAAIVLLLTNPALADGDLIPWVRAGFAPTNAAYEDAGHDGVTIGAVEYQPPPPPPPPPSAGGAAPLAAAFGFGFKL